MEEFAGLSMLKCRPRLIIVRIIPVANERPQESSRDRCPPEAVPIITIISSFSCVHAPLSRIVIAARDAPITLATSLVVIPPKQ
jgi:hypothetical protein